MILVDMKVMINLIVLNMLCIVAYAQDFVSSFVPQIPSPTAQELYRFGSIPVSHFTGEANITIPIYSTEVRNIPLEIALRYDTKGFRVNSVPGSMGHNWSMVTGGVITRELNGQPDEWQYKNPGHKNLYTFHNYFSSTEKVGRLITTYSGRDSIPYLTSRDRPHMYDVCADIFHFNFMGKSGSFLYAGNGQWVVKSNDNISVEFDVADSSNYVIPTSDLNPIKFPGSYVEDMPKVIKGFTLIDNETGTKYVFGGSYATIEYTINPGGSSVNLLDVQGINYWNTWNATSWYLSEVIDRLGNRVYSFHYSEAPLLLQASYIFEYDFLRYGNVFEGAFGGVFWEKFLEDNTIAESKIDSFAVSLCAPVNLYCINIYNTNQMNTISIDFEYNDGLQLNGDNIYPEMLSNAKLLAQYRLSEMLDGYYQKPYNWILDDSFYRRCYNTERKHMYDVKAPYRSTLKYTGVKSLKWITITNGGDDPIKKYSFKYSEEGKFHLTEVDVLSSSEENGWDEKLIGKYRFQYNNIGQIPSEYYSTAYNWWGYFNGQEFSHFLNSNPSTSTCGMLKEIVYPTGGSTLITYEPNYCQKVVNEKRELINSNHTIGGLRIRSLINMDSQGNEVGRKEYSYANGIARNPLFIYMENFQDSDEKTTYLHVSNSSLIPLVNDLGIAIGYSSVSEIDYDKQTRIDYEYTNYDKYNDRPSLYSMRTDYGEKFGERSYLRGKLLKKQLIDLKQNRKVQEIQYEYNDFEGGYEPTDFIVWLCNFQHRTVYDTYTGTNDNYPGFMHLGDLLGGSVYEFYYPKFDIKSITTKQYTSNGVITDIEEYKMDYYNIGETSPKLRLCSAVLKKRLGGSGNEKYIKYEYPTDSYVYPEFVNNHYFPIIKESLYKDENLYNRDKFQAITTEYNIINGLLLPKRQIKEYYNTRVKDTLITFDTYTHKGLLEKYTEIGKPQTRLYRDQNDNVVGSVCGNIDYEDVSFTLGETPERTLMYKEKSIFCIPNTKSVVTLYNTRGLVKSISTGLYNTLYYEYDLMDRLSKIKDHKGNVLQEFKYHYASGEN